MAVGFNKQFHKSLSDYKTRMEFVNKDFNADESRQYDEIRREMTRIYSSATMCGITALPPYLLLLLFIVLVTGLTL